MMSRSEECSPLVEQRERAAKRKAERTFKSANAAAKGDAKPDDAKIFRHTRPSTAAGSVSASMRLNA